MSIDNVQLYSNASVIIYDYYPYGTLLVSCIMDIFKMDGYIRMEECMNGIKMDA